MSGTGDAETSGWNLAGRDIGAGGCRCDAVRFETRGAPLITMACHCRGCQRMTASAYSLSAFYPASQFRLVSGEPVPGGLHGSTRHLFCPQCLSWVYTQPEGLSDFVNIRSTMFDRPPDQPSFIETVVSEALPWARLNARHAFDHFPPREAFPALIAEFLKVRGQPQ